MCLCVVKESVYCFPVCACVRVCLILHKLCNIMYMLWLRVCDWPPIPLCAYNCQSNPEAIRVSVNAVKKRQLKQRNEQNNRENKTPGARGARGPHKQQTTTKPKRRKKPPQTCAQQSRRTFVCVVSTAQVLQLQCCSTFYDINYTDGSKLSTFRMQRFYNNAA